VIRAIIQVVLNGVAILLIAKLVPGIEYQGDWLYLLLTGLVVGVLNLFVRPIVTLLSLPFIIVTLGLFFFAINGLMIYFAAALLDGLTVTGCLPALLGGIVMAFFNWIIRAFSTS
jgi:putative membrane protein